MKRDNIERATMLGKELDLIESDIRRLKENTGEVKIYVNYSSSYYIHLNNLVSGIMKNSIVDHAIKSLEYKKSLILEELSTL